MFNNQRQTFLDCSELELEGELDRARAADLIQRIEAAALASASKRVIQHHRGFPELRRAQVVDRASEIGMVEDVEEIASRLKRHSFCESELAAQSDVPLGGAETSQCIAAKIALRGGRHRSGERRWVDNLAPGCTRRIKIERHIGHDIRTLHASGA